MKEKLAVWFGGVGFIIWYILSVLFFMVPIWATGLPILVMILLAALIYYTDMLGAVLTVAVYIYSFIKVIHSPFSFFSIVYFIVLLIYVIFFFIPALLNLILTWRSRHS